MPGFRSEGGWSFWPVGCERSSSSFSSSWSLKLHIYSSLNPDPTVSKGIKFNIHSRHKSC